MAADEFCMTNRCCVLLNLKLNYLEKRLQNGGKCSRVFTGKGKKTEKRTGNLETCESKGRKVSMFVPSDQKSYLNIFCRYDSILLFCQFSELVDRK